MTEKEHFTNAISYMASKVTIPEIATIIANGLASHMTINFQNQDDVEHFLATLKELAAELDDHAE